MRRMLSLLAVTGALALSSAVRLSAAALSAQIDPPEAAVGDDVTVTFTIQGGSADRLVLPAVEGLEVKGNPMLTTSLTFSNGTLSRSMSESFHLVPDHAGDFTIPAFDVKTTGGEVLHGKALKLHVVAVGVGGVAVPSLAQPTPPEAVKTTTAPVNPNGPVVMPPNSPAAPADASQDDPYASVPKDADGGPAKVFMIISPQTTDAYVGQSIPIYIDFYIRMESNADQNSLPTIKGSDFLMNNFSVRGRASLAMVENIQYERDTWISAISAPKSGDFPLAVERDTYWQKSTLADHNDPFSALFSRHQNLAHEMVASNQLLMHVHALPEEGRPEHFTGAIGQFKVTGEAAPPTVAMGEPVKLKFVVNGVGNFDYVRCPAMPDDPDWKSYVASAKTFYSDESRTHALKVFEQSVVPLKNGNVQLQAAIFSYFDPTTRQYVTTPIALPEITVTGTVTIPAAPPEDASVTTTTSAAPNALPDFVPNRLEIGRSFATLTPVYRKAWFWIVQAGLFGLAVLGGLFFFLRPRRIEDGGRVERARLHSSRQQDEQAMSDAVQRNDPLAFFTAARHAVQLQLGSQWKVAPEALTLGEIRQRDPQVAEAIEPLFLQADEVIYSGRASGPIELAQWERTVQEILQPQAVTP